MASIPIAPTYSKYFEFMVNLLKVGWGVIIVMAIRLLFISPTPSLNRSILFLYSLAILIYLLTFALLSTSFRHKFESSSRIKHAGLVFCLLLGGGLRIWWAVQHPAEPIGDFLEHHKIALGLVNGVVQATYTRPLGYPAILALAYLIKSDPIAGRILNTILGMVTILLVYKIGQKTGGEGAGFLGAFIIALLPTEILMTGTLNAEVGAASLFTGVLYLLLKAAAKDDNKTHTRYLLFAGALYGVGLLFRSSLIFHLIWVAALAGYISTGPWFIKLRAASLFLLMVVTAQSALLAWHSMASGRLSWTLFQSNTLSYMLVSGTNWEARGQFDYPDADMYAAWPEDQRWQRSIQTAWQRITDHPARFPVLVVAKMSNLFADSRYGTYFAFYPLPEGDPIEMENWKAAVAILEQAGYIFMLILGWMYLFKAGRPYHFLLIVLLAAVVFTTLPHILLEVNGRYHHALIPLLGAAAGIGGWQLTEKSYELIQSRSTSLNKG